MRIEFPHSTREDFRWTQASLRLGSAPDNDLVLASPQVAAHHLRIEQDRRGWVLQVLPAGGRIYVNARPVRERALLRAGDVLSIGECRLQLRADEDPGRRAPQALADAARCTAALRAVAGPLSGRVFPLRERLELGSSGEVPLELPQGASADLVLGWRDGQLEVEARSLPERYPLRVNGAPVRQARLRPDDQLGIGVHRFVIDAPGLRPIPKIVMPDPPAPPSPEAQAGPRGEVWWLILTAAVLALGIALVLLFRF
ncbi:FHA domain-containing protein [Frateuria defendens]|uniref:FHA domain-containing protein n=1 Tax=Frateuria defendens TaxID=2219559 RepID=UPI00066FFCC5|nr:FHA domain-containing protein [Frateuria defendens]